MDAATYTYLQNSPAGWVMALLLGAVCGSFINVVIYRVPRNLSLIRPPSSCPNCKRRVRPLENIPIVSYLLLRGCCRGCKARIPLRYPLVESLGAGLMLLAFCGAPDVLTGVVWSAFSLALLAVVFIDLDFRIIPDSITLPGTILGLIWALLSPFSFRDAALGVLTGGGGLLLIALVYQRITGREGLGMGDVKLMAMVGAFLGWQGALGTVLCGSLVGSLVGGALVLRGRGTRLTALPFGTFLAPAAWLVLFLGHQIWNAYLSLFPA